MAFDFPVPMFAAIDFWMTRWLTPIWFLGGGVILGLLVLSVFLVVFYGLSKFTQFDAKDNFQSVENTLSEDLSKQIIQEIFNKVALKW